MNGELGHPLVKAAARFLSRPGAVVGVVVLALLIGGDGLAPADWSAVNAGLATLTPAFEAAALAGLIGAIWGTLTLFAGGIDAGRRLGGLPLALAAALAPVLFGGGHAVLVLAAGLAGSPMMAVAAHGILRNALRSDCLMAARMLGESDARSFVRHILPHIAAPLAAAAWRGAAPALLAVVLAGAVGGDDSGLGVSWGVLMMGRTGDALVAAVLTAVALAAVGAVGGGLRVAARLEGER